ncbi:MAG: hypothetical protein R2827_00960 [Bdellovibrionales bacterium]
MKAFTVIFVFLMSPLTWSNTLCEGTRTLEALKAHQGVVQLNNCNVAIHLARVSIAEGEGTKVQIYAVDDWGRPEGSAYSDRLGLSFIVADQCAPQDVAVASEKIGRRFSGPNFDIYEYVYFEFDGENQIQTIELGRYDLTENRFNEVVNCELYPYGGQHD